MWTSSEQADGLRGATVVPPAAPQGPEDWLHDTSLWRALLRERRRRLRRSARPRAVEQASS